MAIAIGAAATLASFEEILTAPKPGLVDPLHCGSHCDMSWITFLHSAAALAPFWAEQAAEGLLSRDDDALMAGLRARGIEMESAMFEATEGVNTHKGLVFALSLLAGAAGSCLARYGACTPERICKRAAEIAAPVCREEFEKISCAGLERASTHGQKIFLRHGIGGIRKETMDGFPMLLERGLPSLEAALSSGAGLNDAALSALLSIMAGCEDTNVIHRGGFDFWRATYRERASATFERFDPAQPGRYEALKELDDLLLAHRASPGGAADLLVCTLFLYRSKIPGNIPIQGGTES